MSKKVKSYTLMEVTIAMLLSAICIGICYSTMQIIERYYIDFQKKHEANDAVISLKQVITRDILKANIVKKSSDGFRCEGDSIIISYLFSDKRILRQLESLKTDTFKLDWKDLQIAFEGKVLTDLDTADLISFKIKLDTTTTIPFIFSKQYSAHNLFR